MLLITRVGQLKLLRAYETQTQIEIAKARVSNNADNETPTEDWTDIPPTVWYETDQITVSHPTETSVQFSFTIPMDKATDTARIIGLYDTDDDLIFVAQLDSIPPALADQTYNLIFDFNEYTGQVTRQIATITDEDVVELLLAVEVPIANELLNIETELARLFQLAKQNDLVDAYNRYQQLADKLNQAYGVDLDRLANPVELAKLADQIIANSPAGAIVGALLTQINQLNTELQTLSADIEASYVSVWYQYLVLINQYLALLSEIQLIKDYLCRTYVAYTDRNTICNPIAIGE